MLLSEAIIPYAGTQGIRLYQTRPEVKAVLREAGIRYHEEYWANKDETVPNPWHVLIADDVMSLFFARNGKLFKSSSGCAGKAVCSMASTPACPWRRPEGWTLSCGLTTGMRSGSLLPDPGWRTI